MYSKLVQLESREKNNIFFSPYSISAAMAICYEGAEGTTMFFIEDRKTNCIHFMGKVGYPNYEETGGLWSLPWKKLLKQDLLS
ncbi:Serine protease inhibitor (serpin family) [Methanosarcina siciliae C2J]|uniref:Serine protease inhibitor (Serpin family) n=1 Tax=Methanosarcina siciliae C2J TaxID=1434118 RepID=A0A0E3PQC2_9EURY|nr:Serine protease inhibitor (serpin family) [Methanosarcina siciliae C2J]